MISAKRGGNPAKKPARPAAGAGKAAANPIEHVVIIIKENHSFDNYFGTYPGANGVVLPAAQDPPAGGDPPHDHAAWLKRATGAVKLQYKQTDIPVYFSYAQQYTLCDNYFTDVASQSEPNHLMLIAANSPLIDNYHSSHPGEHGEPVPPFKRPSLPAALAPEGHDWRDYADPSESYFNDIAGLSGDPS